MKVRLTIAAAALLLVVGAALVVVGILGFAGQYDIDADRMGMAVVGFVYGSIGALLANGGWRLWQRARRQIQ